MAQFSKNNSNSWGQEYLGWDITERPRYNRGMFWYVGMVVVGGGLLIYSLIDANFLFALIIIMFALIMYLTNMKEPRDVRFSITENGIALGSNFYPFKDIRRFWFIYDPPAIKNIYFEFKSTVNPRITVFLEDVNPNEVRQVLSQYAFEDFSEDEEPFVDYLSRIMKL